MNLSEGIIVFLRMTQKLQVLLKHYKEISMETLIAQTDQSISLSEEKAKVKMKLNEN
jgi:uncharacterized membrane protein